MITLTTRQKEIIEFLLEKNIFVTSKELASFYAVSSRTIRKDLDHVQLFLKENVVLLIRKQGKGVYIQAGSDAIKKLGSILNKQENIVYSKSERLAIAQTLLLIFPNITFQKIADFCYVSKQTVINDFEEIKRNLNENHIQIKKVQGVGLHVEGEEIEIRRRFLDLILCSDHSRVILEVCCHNQVMKKYIDICNAMINKIQTVLHYKYLDKKRVELILAFVLDRIDHQHYLKETSNLKMTNEEVEKIAGILHQYISADLEIEYISSILVSERIEGRMTDEDEILHEARAISEYLIDELQDIHDFDRESLQDTIHGLHLHMKAAIYRCQNNIHIRNELIEQVYYTIPVIYEFTKKKIKVVEENYDLSFDENEISYIALYLASIFETGIQESLRVRIMIICAFGLATSSILKARMYQIFGDCDIIGPYSIEEAKEYLKQNTVDLILSTNEFEIEDESVLYIHPLLKQSDIEIIRDTLFQKSFSKMCSLFFSKKNDQKQDRHFLKEYIPYDHVQICFEKNISWEEAIRMAAKPLIRKNYINQKYVQAMINAVNDYGTYMVFTPKVAYVHASKEDGVRQNCVSLLVLKNELPFGSFNIKQINMIVVLGVYDKEQNQMMNIANILDKKENVQKMNELSDVCSILDLHD